MVKLTLKKNLKEYDPVLGYKQIKLLFNAGPFPGGGDCLIVEADGEITEINSSDLIADLDAYNMSSVAKSR
jgi:hypothetical protein